MMELIFEDDIRRMVACECDFTIEDHGIGYYEMGDGKYNDISMELTLTPSSIVVQYPVETESAIIVLVTGTYEEEEYECDYIAELVDVIYDTDTKTWDATYEVYQD